MRRSLVLSAVLVAALSVTAVASARRSSISSLTVTITDATLRASSTAPASGKTVLVVVNKGKKAHALMVKGPGVKGVSSPSLRPGQRAKVTVTFRPGAYVLSDPVGLGEFNVLYLDVVKSATLSGSGSSNTVTPPATLPPMCGQGYTP